MIIKVTYLDSDFVKHIERHYRDTKAPQYNNMTDAYRDIFKEICEESKVWKATILSINFIPETERCVRI